MSINDDKILNQYNIKYLFHMTHIDNLASILRHGLYSHNNQAEFNPQVQPHLSGIFKF